LALRLDQPLAQLPDSLCGLRVDGASSSGAAFDALPGYFDQRMRPALQSLLESASAAGQVRADVNPNDLLHAVANLCLPADAERSGHAHRMVDLLIDGLRYGASAPASGNVGSRCHGRGTSPPGVSANTG
jgi:hypothetical protein